MNQSFPKTARGQRLITVQYGEASHFCKPTFATQSYINTWTDTRNGSENPNWKRQVKSGVNATTGFNGFRQFYKRGMEGSAFVIVKTNPLEICQPVREVRAKGDIVGLPHTHTPLGIDTGTVLNMALGDFNRRASEILRPVMGAVSAGELNKTLRMMMSPAKALRQGIEDYYKALKKVPRNSSTSVRKRALVDTYLEHTFGWKPLLADIQGAHKALKAFKAGGGSETTRVTGYGELKAAGFSTNSSISYGILQIDFQDMTRKTTSVKVYGGVRTKSNGNDGSLLDNLGFYPDNFLPTAWELLPYSFLIDYFTNIGTMIDAWSLVDGRVSWSCMTQRVEQVTIRCCQRVNTAILGTSYKKSGLVPAQHSLVTRAISRLPLNSTLPSLAFRLPGFGTKQMLNIASLLYSKEVKRPFY